MSCEDRPLWHVLLGAVIALAIAMGIGRFVYTPVLPVMVAALDLSKSEAGLIASANFLGYLIGALLASTPWISGSRRRIVVMGLIASAVTTALMGAATGQLAFLALRLLGGVASAFVLVHVSVIAIQMVTNAGHAAYATVHFAGVGIGIAASALLVAGLLAAGAGWAGLWYASGALSLVGAIAVALLIPEQRQEVAASEKGRIDLSLLPFIFAYGLFGFGYVITATFIVAITRETPALIAIEPWIWLIAGLAGAPSVAFWSWIAKQIGLIEAFAIACLVESFGVAMSVLWISVPGIIVSAMLLGGTFMGITALGLIGARRSIAGDPSRMLALMTVSFGIGQIIGPGFAGWLADWTGSYLIPSLTASGALLLAALIAYLRDGKAHSIEA